MNQGSKSTRSIHYVHGTTVLQELDALKGTPWMALIYAGEYHSKNHAPLVKKLLQAEPLFVFGVASNFSLMEDEIAEELMLLTGDFNEDDPLPIIMADQDLEEGLLFCRDYAFHETKSIEKVYVIDLLNVQYSKELADLIAIKNN